MISKEPKWGLLQSVTKQEVQNIEEPNLLREYFPYSEIPYMVFDGKSVPMEPAKDFFITDTTFRDGQQARPPYTVEQIVHLYKMLNRLGGPNGVIRASEFFLYSDKDKEAVRKCLELGYKYPEVTGWIRATKGDFQIVKELGLKETGILTSASDYHIFLKFGKTREQILEQYLDLVYTALESGFDAVRCHLEDVTRADFPGFIIPFVQKAMELAQQEKGKAVKIRLCDTMGYGLPYAEATLPRSVPKMIHCMIHECGVPSEWLEWHGHNDFHKVNINATTAWLYGCAAANSTLLGFGERTGNPPLEAAVIDYIALRGDANGMDTRVITEIAEYFREMGVVIPDNYPFVGSNFNVTSAGIHADGMLKNEEIYNIFDTAKILNRPTRVNVTDKSGLAGIAHWVNAYLGLKPENAVDKRHPSLSGINDWVKEQYDNGRITSISDSEMLTQARLHLPEYFKSDFDKLREHALSISEKIVAELAEDAAVKSMDAKKAEKALKKAVDKHAFVQFAYVTDKKGKKITDNITQPQYQAEFGAFGLNEDFSDRDWFKGAIDAGEVFITEFYKSRITGALCVTVSAPIMDGDSEALGVIGADLKFEELARMHDALA